MEDITKKIDIYNRAIELGEYVIEKQATVRQVAKEYNVSKSTAHKDLAERLKKIDLCLYELVKEVLERNKSMRCIRGGMATKRKYQR